MTRMKTSVDSITAWVFLLCALNPLSLKPTSAGECDLLIYVCDRKKRQRRGQRRFDHTLRCSLGRIYDWRIIDIYHSCQTPWSPWPNIQGCSSRSKSDPSVYSRHVSLYPSESQCPIFYIIPLILLFVPILASLSEHPLNCFHFLECFLLIIYLFTFILNTLPAYTGQQMEISLVL